MKSKSIFVRGAASFVWAMLAIAVVPASAGEIYVGDINGVIGEYDTSGATGNASFISTGQGYVGALAVSGGDLFVAGVGTGGNTGSVGVYDATTGAPVNAALITGLNSPGGIAVSGNDLFVDSANGTTVSEYNATTGAPINPVFISGLTNPVGLSIFDGELFVLGLNGKLGEYDATTGATVNAAIVSGLAGPNSLTVAGTAMYIANSNGSNGLSAFTTSGTSIHLNFSPPLSGILAGVGVANGDLFLARAQSGLPNSGTIGEYSLSGTTINAALFSGLENNLTALVVTPEPSSWVMLAIGAAALLARGRRERRA